MPQPNDCQCQCQCYKKGVEDGIEILTETFQVLAKGVREDYTDSCDDPQPFERSTNRVRVWNMMWAKFWISHAAARRAKGLEVEP